MKLVLHLIVNLPLTIQRHCGLYKMSLKGLLYYFSNLNEEWINLSSSFVGAAAFLVDQEPRHSDIRTETHKNQLTALWVCPKVTLDHLIQTRNAGIIFKVNFWWINTLTLFSYYVIRFNFYRYFDEIEMEGLPVEKTFNRQSQQSRYSDNVSMYPSSRHSQHSSYRSKMATGENLFFNAVKIIKTYRIFYFFNILEYFFLNRSSVCRIWRLYGS